MVSLGHGAHVALAVKKELPPELRQVWRWFSHLHVKRDYSRLTEPVQMPNGHLGWQVKAKALHLAPERVLAWSAMTGVEIEPWQFAALELVDEFFVKINNDPPPVAVAATASNLLVMLRALGLGKNKVKKR